MQTLHRRTRSPRSPSTDSTRRRTQSELREPTRCRSIPLRVLLDAFATEDEDLAPEPEWFDFVGR